MVGAPLNSTLSRATSKRWCPEPQKFRWLSAFFIGRAGFKHDPTGFCCYFGDNLCPPTTSSPKPSETKPPFSSNRKEIDNSPVLRYCSGQKKRGLNFLYIMLPSTSR